MRLYERALKRAATTAPVRWAMQRFATPLDLALKGSRFAPSRLGVDLPLCFLTTTGSRTGRPRTVPLLFVPFDDDAVVVVASNFGRERRPAWAHNLDARPTATIEIDGTSHRVDARRATPAEVADLWPLFDGVWPGYETYRATAGRDIEMFVLSPRERNDGPDPAGSPSSDAPGGGSSPTGT